MRAERDLIDAFATAAHGHQRDAVVGAAANLILNALRQSHPTLGAAEEELDDLVARMKLALASKHYGDDGRRKVQNVIFQKPLMEMLRDLAN